MRYFFQFKGDDYTLVVTSNPGTPTAYGGFGCSITCLYRNGGIGSIAISTCGKEDKFDIFKGRILSISRALRNRNVNLRRGDRVAIMEVIRLTLRQQVKLGLHNCDTVVDMTGRKWRIK